MSTVEETRNKRASVPAGRANAGNQQSKRTNNPKPSPAAHPPNKPTPVASSPVTPQLREEHVPINGFNAADVDALLKSGHDPKATLYKPDQNTAATKPNTPWGARPGVMASGRDFWADLRRQVTSLQKGETKGG